MGSIQATSKETLLSNKLQD